jgi:hypothetical protein
MSEQHRMYRSFSGGSFTFLGSPFRCLGRVSVAVIVAMSGLDGLLDCLPGFLEYLSLEEDIRVVVEALREFIVT